MTIYHFDELVTARRTMSFKRQDGRVLWVYECQRGKVITPCEWADNDHSGLMLVAWENAGYFWVAPRDVQGDGK